MSDHTRPRHAFDETIHVPLIVRWPGHVPAGKRNDMLVRNYDLLPTLLDSVGLTAKIPDFPPLPGQSFAAALRGDPLKWDNVAFYEFETARAVRTDDWKYVRRVPKGPNELYDLKHDLGERVNLVDRPDHAEVQKTLGRRLDEFFARYADPQYDVWHGGKSKAPRLRD
jgi:arylsulfatase A-like enzyme